MNRLEQRIFNEITWNRACLTEEEFKRAPQENERIARIAVSICLEVAEKAYNAGSRDPEVDDTVSFEDFKKEIL